ncbi:MAG: hypothetical protein L0G59_10320, partial [Kocuria sp.]|nr:hypothetical protein [Kocuria sp.]
RIPSRPRPTVARTALVGLDPLTAAPAPITAQQRKETGVDAKPTKTGEKKQGPDQGQSAENK